MSADLESRCWDDGLLQGAGELLPGVHDVLGRATRHRYPVPVCQFLQVEPPPAQPCNYFRVPVNSCQASLTFSGGASLIPSQLLEVEPPPTAPYVNVSQGVKV